MKAEKWGYIDTSGEIVIPSTFDLAAPHFHGVATVTVGRSDGAIDVSGNWIIEPRFESIGVFQNGIAYAAQNGLYGFIDLSGAFVVPPRFTSVPFPFSEGLCEVDSGEVTGYIDQSGEFIIAPQFATASPFSEGYAVVSFPNDAHLYFIDKTGARVFGPFNSAESFAGGVALVGRISEGQWFINRNGDVLLRLPGEIQAEGCFFDGLAVASLLEGGPEVFDVQMGYIDRAGDWAIAPIFDQAFQFRDRRACVLLKGKHGMIDIGGNVLIRPEYDDLENVSCNRILFRRHGKAGFLDPNGEVVIKARYRSARSFSDGLAAVCSST